MAHWWQNDRDTLVQYNSVSNTALDYFQIDNQDDQGFDADIDTARSIVQYNFSYRNAGGFYFDCCGQEGRDGGIDAIIRYNVSQGTPLGRQAKEYMDRGDLVPD